MQAPEGRLRYEDLDRLDPEQRWELIDGVAYAMASPLLVHQLVLGELYVALKQHFRGSRCQVVLAPFDVKISDYDVVQPDLLVSCGEGLGARFHAGAPDLAIEILSPSSLRQDRIRKLNFYARAGVSEYWLVTPSPLMVEVFRHHEGLFFACGGFGHDQVLESPRFPELRLDLAAVYAALPPDEDAEAVRESPPVYAVPAG